MKKNLCFLLFAMLLSISTFAQWQATQQNTNLAQSRGIQTISVIDANIVWADSYDGSGAAAVVHDYIKTNDGGLNWTAGTVPATAGWQFSHFAGFSDTMAWVVLYSATVVGAEVYCTLDGGLSWQARNPFSATAFADVVHFFNDQEGLLVGDPESNYFEIYTTANQGVTWTRVPSASIPAPLAGEYGLTRSIGSYGDNVWFGTNKSRIFRSNNKGLTWSVANIAALVGVNATISEFAMESATTGMCFAAGTDTVNRIIKTVDGGATWTQVVSNFQNAGFIKWRNAMSYVPGTNPPRYFVTGARAATSDHGSVYTENYGTTWVTVDSAVQHLGTGWADINNGWSGGFTGAAGTGGMFVWTPGVINNYNVTLLANPVPGGSTSGAGTYASGTSVSVTATANAGYTFVNWTENGVIVSTNSTYSFTLTGNRNLVANFTQVGVNYTITLSANPAPGGTTTGGGTYVSGITASVSAAANASYTFVNWTENGVIVSTSNPYSFSVTANRNLVANFTQTSANYTLSLSANPAPGGTTSGAGSYTSGTSVTASATVNTGYSFSNWTENGVIISTNINYTFNLTSDRTLVANFIQNYIISLSSNPLVGGSTSGAGTYAAGFAVTVTATPNANYQFDNWTENGVILSTNNSYSFSIAGDKNLVANFSLIIGVEPSALVSIVKVYPNPSQGQIVINSQEKLTLKVYNPIGQLVLSQSVEKGANKLSLTENGLFMFVFIKEGQVPYIIKQINNK